MNNSAQQQCMPCGYRYLWQETHFFFWLLLDFYELYSCYHDFLILAATCLWFQCKFLANNLTFPDNLCIITKFSGLITNDKSDVHTKGQGHRSKVKVAEVITQLSRFRTVTPVWIYIWCWNDAQSLMMHRRGSLLFFKVIRQISRSHG